MLTIFEQITETEHIHFNYISILRSQSEWFVCVCESVANVWRKI